MKKTFSSMFLFMLLLSVEVSANEYPPQWPWKGVTIENTDFLPSDLSSIAHEIPMNSVQLRLKPRKLAKLKKISANEAWKESLVWGSQMLDQCKQLGIVAIMTVEGFPIDPTKDYNQTSATFWKNPQDLNEVVRLATEMAKYYSDRGRELVAYQLLSEPVITQDFMLFGKRSVQPPAWPRLAKRIITAIRKYDSKRWVAIAPGPWGGAGAYSSFKPLKFDRVIYGAHVYVPHAFTHQGIRQWKVPYVYPGEIKGKDWNKNQLMSSMKPLRDFQKRYDVPIWIGEFSAIRWAKGGERYIKDLVSIFQGYGWSWTYFTINGWHGWMPDYNQEYGMKSNTVEDRQKLEAQKVGFDSERWKTLKLIFGDVKQ